MPEIVALDTRRQSPILPMASAWAVALVAVAALLRGELAGWLLIALSYLLIAAIGSVHRNRRLVTVLLLTVTLSHLLSLTNVYAFQVWSGTKDAEAFHRLARSSAASASSLFDWQGQTGSSFYVWFLARWYILFGTHLLAGQTMSILAFLGFCVLVYRIALLTGLDRRQAAYATLVAGILPSTLMFVSVTLREPWKLFFVALMLYASLRYFEDLSRIHFFFIWILSGFALMLLHEGFGLLLAVLLILPFALLSRNSTSREPARVRILMLAGSFLAILFWLRNPFGIGIAGAPGITTGNPLLDAESARASALYNVGRASYGVPLDTSSMAGFFTTVPLIYTMYLAAPFPWQIRAPIDLYGFLDVMIGLLFLFAALRAYRTLDDSRLKRQAAYLLLAFFAITLVHAMGTANYGTSIRHRQLTTWITVILGWPVAAGWVKRLRLHRHGG